MVEIIKLVEISENYIVEKECETTEDIILGPLIFMGHKEDEKWSQLRYGEALEKRKRTPGDSKGIKAQVEGSFKQNQLHGQMHRMQG